MVPTPETCRALKIRLNQWGRSKSPPTPFLVYFRHSRRNPQKLSSLSLRFAVDYSSQGTIERGPSCSINLRASLTASNEAFSFNSTTSSVRASSALPIFASA